MGARTRLARVRKQQGIAAAELARTIGVSRQTIYAIEDGTYVPNTTVALRLARALGTTVEDLFALQDSPEIVPESLSADLLQGDERPLAAEGQLVRLCRVNNRMIAVPALPPSHFPAMDGVVRQRSGSQLCVSPFAASIRQGFRLLLAGCDPALSLLNDLLNPSGFEIVTVGASSRRSLRWLRERQVHAAGSHLLDDSSGEFNVPFVKRLFPNEPVRVVTFATWEQGLVVLPGNPKRIDSIADLQRREVKIVNREDGSGSRKLLDSGLSAVGVPGAQVRGYKNLAYGHLKAAQAVAARTVDCCIATRSAARCYGLDFVPLAVERFDLSFAEEGLNLPVGRALLDALNLGSFRNKLAFVAGYETRDTGKVQF